ncbi:C-type lectin [Elysia marginata]|uniref:C-type lectin n=1 Tax=Elysia marginata TaxID=1093978 RepID=A0AAV4EZ92_9GAST|nr:C-type lectin [Elysia marginata]
MLQSRYVFAFSIFFYYSMVGKDVQGLDVTVKTNSGIGYPVWSSNGPQISEWTLGMFQLDSEYTANYFSVEFIASTKAFTRYDVYYYDEADIGIDDLYAYNTTCDQIPKCPSNSIHHNTLNNTTSCYTFHVGALSWKDAYHTCRKEGPWSALVSVESQQEQDYLTGVINNDTVLTSAGQFGFFTSGNDLKSEHTFVWTDTGSARPVKGFFENWHAHQPNNSGLASQPASQPASSQCKPREATRAGLQSLPAILNYFSLTASCRPRTAIRNQLSIKPQRVLKTMRTDEDTHNLTNRYHTDRF